MTGKSSCESCNANPGETGMDVPVYCIPCIEEIGQKGLSLKRHREHRNL